MDAAGGLAESLPSGDTMTLVSVLMPVYNAERYLAESITSILRQGFTNFEFIIIDDGSTDRSLEIIKGFAAGDSRIRVISRPNTGYVVALNEGLELAKGILLARMDADDIALQGRFEEQVRLMERHPDILCVGGGLWLIDEHSRKIGEYYPPTEDEEIQKNCLEGKPLINHPSAMFRLDMMKRVGGYDQALYGAEDLDIYLRLGEHGRLANLEQKTTCYRIHNKSVSHTKKDEQRRNSVRACENAWRRRNIKCEFINEPSMRPSDERETQYHFAVAYARWGFQNGFRNTALTYSIKALRMKPWKVRNWLRLIRSIFSPLPVRKGRE